MADHAGEFNTLLSAAGTGDSRAAAALLPLVYEELRELARARLAQRAANDTLQPTALVHEAYLRLVGQGDPGWNGRAHFFGAAAKAMRNVLVDRARQKAAEKHGGGVRRLALDPELGVELNCSADEILALDEALDRLEQHDPSVAQIVMLKHFAGLSDEETARTLDMSDRSVRREWRYGRAWLQRALGANEIAEP